MGDFFAFYQHVLRLYLRLNNYLALTSFCSQRKGHVQKCHTTFIIQSSYSPEFRIMCTKMCQSLSVHTPMHTCLFTCQSMVFPQCHFIVSTHRPTDRVFFCTSIKALNSIFNCLNNFKSYLVKYFKIHVILIELLQLGK